MRDTIKALLDAKLPSRRYGVFFSTSEGHIMPSGEEDASGFVVDETGDHFFYWTGWHTRFGGVHLEVWTREQFQEEWGDVPEYLAARRQAGLAALGTAPADAGCVGEG